MAAIHRSPPTVLEDPATVPKRLDLSLALSKIEQNAAPSQPPLVSESGLDFAARAQPATVLRADGPTDRGSLPRELPDESSRFSLPLYADVADRSPGIADPDLGVLRLRRPAKAGDTAGPQPPPPNCDPELGCLRLKEPLPLPPIVTAAPRAPVVYLIARIDYFRTSNLSSNQDPVTDGLTRPGLTLYASPMLGRDTYFVASATGNLLRYSTQSLQNTDELFFRAGILQRLSPNMFGEIGWSNQQLRLAGSSARTGFLNEHAIRLEISRRDQLAGKLSLNSFYQFRYSFADPIDRSRLTNALTLSLNYDLQPNLQLGLDYQLGLATFTQQQRRDVYHQVLGRLSYTILRNTQVSAFVGYGFGNSSDPAIRFNSLLVGVSVNLTLGLF